MPRKSLDAAKTSGNSPTLFSRNFFSILQAADYTATNPSWVEDEMRRGNLPYRWAGNRRVILREHLDALILNLPEESGACEVPLCVKK